METIKRAYAKINIGLHVCGNTKSGYHKLDMIMTPIELYDEIIFKDSSELIVNMDNDVCPMKNNLCFKVAKYLIDEYKIDKGISITINKKIPSQAGLGGGSSDAATVLMFLNDYFNLQLNKKELIKIGMKFGCDIPFFIENNISRVRGLGEKVKPLKIKENNKPIMLIVPPFAMDTKTVFQNYKDKNKNFISNLIKKLKKGIIIPTNDLEKTVDTLTKNGISNIKEKISGIVDCNLMMTGSGSVIVGYLEKELNKEELLNVQKELSDSKLILTKLKMYTY